MGNDAICLEKQGECGAMADAMPVASVEGGDSRIDGLNDKVDVLESKIELLQGTFDVWQKLVESILGTAQASIEYDNYVLTAVIAILTIGGFFATYWFSKSKKDAIKEINESIAKGVIPEGSDVRSKIINAVIDSDEFKEKVKEKVEEILNKADVLALKEFYGKIASSAKTNETQVTPKNLEEDSNTNNEG